MTHAEHGLVVCYQCPETSDAILAELLDSAGLIVEEWRVPCPFDRNRVGPHERFVYRYYCVDPGWWLRWRMEVAWPGQHRWWALGRPQRAPKAACKQARYHPGTSPDYPLYVFPQGAGSRPTFPAGP